MLWLVPAVFVALYDPGVPEPSGQPEQEGSLERVLARGGPEFFLLSHGYTKHWTVETWEGADEALADKTRTSYFVERGPLDRKAGTFRFTLWCGMNHAHDLEGVRLFVSVGDPIDGDEGIWTQVAEARVANPGGDEAVLTCGAIVPASTTAYRLEEVRNGVTCCGFSQSMLTAPTVLGRAYDTIAWRPLFKWVPDFR
jgi:hypothetical protein